MSRIDEALRRAGQGSLRTLSGTSEELFASAWQLGDQVRHRSRPDAPPVDPNPRPARRFTDAVPLTFSFNNGWRERLATAAEAHPVLVEQFRRLAGTLHHAQSASGIRVIMMTSAAPEDGKTLTAINLALVLSQSYLRRVLLIDADLRRPSLGNITGLTNAPGLTDVLKAPTEQKLAVLQIGPNLTLLPAGRPDPDPMGGLTSARMRCILEEASAEFDWVILDAPPMGPMADANLLSEMVDGAVFVLRAGRTQCALVQKAIEALGRERILGVVLNGVARLPHEDYYHSAGAESSDRAGGR